jgi:CO/xanthine dehydrogenase Mo-binding subunit
MITSRPTKLMLPKDQELAYLTVKPENIAKFKVGAKKDGRIVALVNEIYINAGDSDRGAMAGSTGNALMLYAAGIPNWKSTGFNYKSNAIRIGASRSNEQQEVKWAWENMLDEMAEAVGLDPIQFRMLHISKPGTKLSPARDWNPGELGNNKFEIENGALTYDSFASVEVLEEGAKAIGWDKRNPRPGGNSGRFKRGLGVAMSQHHAGNMGYHEGEIGFERLAKTTGGGDAAGGGVYSAEVEVGVDGYVTMKNALPDSGTNHASAMAALTAEMLGFTSRDHIRVIWGDSELTPPSQHWFGGVTTMVQGGAVCVAADKLRKDLLRRAADVLKVDLAKLQIKDGIISSTEDPKKRTTFAELVKANRGVVRQTGRCIPQKGRALNKGIGACFAEVEVDTWTGDWKFLRAVYCHDSGLVINPLLAESDMAGSLVQSTQLTTDPIPWDREFPGTRHYSVGYLSYRLPTIMDVPEQTQVFIDSLEPRWFFGAKSFAETAIGAVPGAISNAIYNACGVRIREHPVTREKIMAGLTANRLKS